MKKSNERFVVALETLNKGLANTLEGVKSGVDIDAFNQIGLSTIGMLEITKAMVMNALVGSEGE